MTSHIAKKIPRIDIDLTCSVGSMSNRRRSGGFAIWVVSYKRELASSEFNWSYMYIIEGNVVIFVTCTMRWVWDAPGRCVHPHYTIKLKIIMINYLNITLKVFLHISVKLVCHVQFVQRIGHVTPSGHSWNYYTGALSYQRSHRNTLWYHPGVSDLQMS